MSYTPPAKYCFTRICKGNVRVRVYDEPRMLLGVLRWKVVINTIGVNHTSIKRTFTIKDEAMSFADKYCQSIEDGKPMQLPTQADMCRANVPKAVAAELKRRSLIVATIMGGRRPNWKFYARVRANDKQPWKYRGFKTREEAEKWVDTVKRALEKAKNGVKKQIVNQGIVTTEQLEKDDTTRKFFMDALVMESKAYLSGRRIGKAPKS